MRTLDDVVDELQIERVQFLKIDTEGYEREVLKGGRATLKMTDIVYFETSDEKLQEYDMTVPDLGSMPEDADFTVYRIGHATKNAVGLRQNPDILARFKQTNLVPMRFGQ